MDVGDFNDFRWPTLLELNDELDTYPWKDDEERQRFMTDDPPFTHQVMYNGPPPLPPTPAPQSSSPPTITKLAPRIISSMDKLFFIAYAFGKAKRKWRLVWVAFTNSISLYPSALQDGWFLVEFYVLHPTNIRYNAINQQYWLQYCMRNGISSSHLDAHLIAPSDTLEEHASRHHLLPICSWVNLTHVDTYIHSPFDFAAVNGRKTWDRVGHEDWDALTAKSSMFCNPTPRFDLPTYSIHVDCGVHTTHQMIAAAENILQPPLPLAFS